MFEVELLTVLCTQEKQKNVSFSQQPKKFAIGQTYNHTFYYHPATPNKIEPPTTRCLALTFVHYGWWWTKKKLGTKRETCSNSPFAVWFAALLYIKTPQLKPTFLRSSLVGCRSLTWVSQPASEWSEHDAARGRCLVFHELCGYEGSFYQPKMAVDIGPLAISMDFQNLYFTWETPKSYHKLVATLYAHLSFRYFQAMGLQKWVKVSAKSKNIWYTFQILNAF